MMKKWLLMTFLLLLTMSALPAAEQKRQDADQSTLEVFVRDGCPHCAEAKAFLPAFEREHPWVRIVYRHVDSDDAARQALAGYSQSADIWPPGVPSFVYDGRMLVGFDNAERTGPQLAELVGRHGPPQAVVESGLLGTLSVSRLGLPLFTLAMGLLDGFNACAMWVLLFLLSLLVHLHDRRRMALIAGTFVLASGAVYYAFMAAWLNFFLLLGISATLHMVLGGVALAIGAVNVKDFMRPGRGFSLSIPDSAKPGIYARMRAVLTADTLPASLAGIAALAVMVNFIELLCTAGLPAIYTSVLAQQDLGPSAHYAYLGLYTLGYIADDTLMVTIAVAALGSPRISVHTGRWLKLLSGTVMIALGVLLILRPELLA